MITILLFCILKMIAGQYDYGSYGTDYGLRPPIEYGGFGAIGGDYALGQPIIK